MNDLNVRRVLFSIVFVFLCFISVCCSVYANQYCVSVGVVGDYSCGKTSLINTFMNRAIDRSHTYQLGLCQFNMQEGGNNYIVTLWDTPGDGDYSAAVAKFLSKLDVIVIVFDAFRMIESQYSESAKRSVRRWIEFADNNAPKHRKIILFGTKTDLVEPNGYSISNLESYITEAANCRNGTSWFYGNIYGSKTMGYLRDKLIWALSALDKSKLRTSNSEVDLRYHLKTESHCVGKDTHVLE